MICAYIYIYIYIYIFRDRDLRHGRVKESSSETEEGAAKVRDRVRVYMQHIRQPNYQQLKEYYCTC